MTQTRDWREMTGWIADLLKKRTGDDVAAWNARIRTTDIRDEAALRAWLTDKGITGYPQMLLVMERFGYPAYLLASSDELVEAQYRDRPSLRPIYDTVLTRVAALGEVTIQARKGYVSLMTPKRTFASVQATTKRRVDLGLRLTDPEPEGRLITKGSFGSSMVTARIPLESVDDVDNEVGEWLARAYRENS